jgi:hypothetical protein
MPLRVGGGLQTDAAAPWSMRKMWGLGSHEERWSTTWARVPPFILRVLDRNQWLSCISDQGAWIMDLQLLSVALSWNFLTFWIFHVLSIFHEIYYTHFCFPGFWLPKDHANIDVSDGRCSNVTSHISWETLFSHCWDAPTGRNVKKSYLKVLKIYKTWHMMKHMYWKFQLQQKDINLTNHIGRWQINYFLLIC